MTRELTPALALAARLAADGELVVDWPSEPTTDPAEFIAQLLCEAQQATLAIMAGVLDGSRVLDITALGGQTFLAGFFAGVEAVGQFGPAWRAWMRECEQVPLLNIGVAEEAARRIVSGASASTAAYRKAAGR